MSAWKLLGHNNYIQRMNHFPLPRCGGPVAWSISCVLPPQSNKWDKCKNTSLYLRGWWSSSRVWVRTYWCYPVIIDKRWRTFRLSVVISHASVSVVNAIFDFSLCCCHGLCDYDITPILVILLLFLQHYPCLRQLINWSVNILFAITTLIIRTPFCSSKIRMKKICIIHGKH